MGAVFLDVPFYSSPGSCNSDSASGRKLAYSFLGLLMFWTILILTLVFSKCRADRKLGTSRIPCQIGEQGDRCPSYYNFFYIIADEIDDQDKKNLEGFFNEVSEDCSENSNLFFLASDTNVVSIDCSKKPCSFNLTYMDDVIFRPCFNYSDAVQTLPLIAQKSLAGSPAAGAVLFLVFKGCTLTNEFFYTEYQTKFENQSIAAGAAVEIVFIDDSPNFRLPETKFPNYVSYKYFANSAQLLDEKVQKELKTCCKGKARLEGWVIALIVIGIFLALAVVIFCVLWYRRRNSGLRFSSRSFKVFLRSASNNKYIEQETARKTTNTKQNFVNDEWEINPDDLFIFHSERFGSGAYALVYKGKLKQNPVSGQKQRSLTDAFADAKHSVRDVAVKTLPPFASQANRENFMKEMKIMKNIGVHPHVLGLVGCSSNPDQPYLITEFCANGDLLNFLRTNQKDFLQSAEKDGRRLTNLTLQNLISFAWQISDGMCYLSSKNIVHRDLAARNILVTRRLMAKVSDFGLSCFTADKFSEESRLFPIKWTALEALKHSTFSTNSDVWSYGIVLYEIFSLGANPYTGIDAVDMVSYLEEGQRLEKPDSCSDNIYELMKACWAQNPEERPSFDNVRLQMTQYLNDITDSYGYLQFTANYTAFTSE